MKKYLVVLIGLAVLSSSVIAGVTQIEPFAVNASGTTGFITANITSPAGYNTIIEYVAVYIKDSQTPTITVFENDNTSADFTAESESYFIPASANVFEFNPGDGVPWYRTTTAGVTTINVVTQGDGSTVKSIIVSGHHVK